MRARGRGGPAIGRFGRTAGRFQAEPAGRNSLRALSGDVEHFTQEYKLGLNPQLGVAPIRRLASLGMGDMRRGVITGRVKGGK